MKHLASLAMIVTCLASVHAQVGTNSPCDKDQAPLQTNRAETVSTTHQRSGSATWRGFPGLRSAGQAKMAIPAAPKRRVGMGSEQ